MARQTAQTPDDGLQRLKADLKNGEFQNFYIFAVKKPICANTICGC